MILLYVPCKNKIEAKEISEKLLSEKLIACVNIIESESIYFWEEKLLQQPETIIIIKTSEEKSLIVQNRIEQLHSYKLPGIIKISCEANKKYEEWILNTVKNIN